MPKTLKKTFFVWYPRIHPRIHPADIRSRLKTDGSVIRLYPIRHFGGWRIRVGYPENTDRLQPAPGPISSILAG